MKHIQMIVRSVRRFIESLLCTTAHFVTQEQRDVTMFKVMRRKGEQIDCRSKIDEEKSTCLSFVKYGIFAANIVFIVRYLFILIFFKTSRFFNYIL